MMAAAAGCEVAPTGRPALVVRDADLHLALAGSSLAVVGCEEQVVDPAVALAFFRGASLRLDIDNIFNNRPKVRDPAGIAPPSYQPDLLEPVGRTIGIAFRKLFIPRRFFQRSGGRRGGS